MICTQQWRKKIENVNKKDEKSTYHRYIILSQLSPTYNEISAKNPVIKFCTLIEPITKPSLAQSLCYCYLGNTKGTTTSCITTTILVGGAMP